MGASETPPAEAPHEFYVLAWGLVAMSICTSLPMEEAERRANFEVPTGISSRWSKSADDYFSNGAEYPNGMACPEYPESHRHWLLNC